MFKLNVGMHNFRGIDGVRELEINNRPRLGRIFVCL